jgi:hypothetical protein
MGINSKTQQTIIKMPNAEAFQNKFVFDVKIIEQKNPITSAKNKKFFQ